MTQWWTTVISLERWHRLPSQGRRLYFSWVYSLKKGLLDSHSPTHEKFLTALYFCLASAWAIHIITIDTVSGEKYTSHYKCFAGVFLKCLEVLVTNMYKQINITVCQTLEWEIFYSCVTVIWNKVFRGHIIINCYTKDKFCGTALLYSSTFKLVVHFVFSWHMANWAIWNNLLPHKVPCCRIMHQQG